MVNNELSGWAESYNVLKEVQAGLRPGMRTVNNIFVSRGLISHMLNKGVELYFAFIDFTKAFDYIARDNLWFVLIKKGVCGKFLNMIKSMYGSVKSRVKFCNQLGQNFLSSLSVLREYLSPLLFSLFLTILKISL